jgi:hypothetical protein
VLVAGFGFHIAMAGEVDNGLIAGLAFVHEPAESGVELGGGGLGVEQYFEVVAIERATRRRTKKIGEGLGIFISKTQVGDARVLIVGDADDDGVGVFCYSFLSIGNW